LSFELRAPSLERSINQKDVGRKKSALKDFKELKVWSKAHETTLQLYRLTRQFPKEELYGLTSQIRRAASSVGANIAEGSGRRSDGEMTRFLHIARGSAVELEYHLLLARDLELLPASNFTALERQVDEIQRMLTSLIQRVQPAGRGLLGQGVNRCGQARSS
jgi:four helix bundle protein